MAEKVACGDEDPSVAHGEESRFLLVGPYTGYLHTSILLATRYVSWVGVAAQRAGGLLATRSESTDAGQQFAGEHSDQPGWANARAQHHPARLASDDLTDDCCMQAERVALQGAQYSLR
ncbi:MAG: hypothetical protein IMY84_05885, partial [Chloroflexi bacterium]|nr:hypothetical protein [Chloroflexota bacterium]